MSNLLSLTKIGNIKIGKVVNGNPLALEKILVTRATKEYEENFQVYSGFDKEGLSELTVTLPFNDIDLNFERNYISFIEVDKVEYIAKSPGLDEDIILHPLNPEDFEMPSLNLGKLTEKNIEQYNFKLTGFLKVMIPEISGYGEVFYFKTGSINTIRAIYDQLRLTKNLLKGNLANIPLTLKPVKKDLQDGTQIVFLSISYDIYNVLELKEDLLLAEMLKDSVEKIEEDYIKSREESEIKDIDKKAKIVILKKESVEVVSLEDKDEKINSFLDKEGITDEKERETIQNLSTKMPLSLVLRYFKVVKAIEGSEYIEVFKKTMEEGISAPDILQKISEYNKK